MANRFWTSNSQRSVESRGHGPAYSRDGGKVLNDNETQPPYNANIGPDGPDLNKVGFPTVKIATKWRYMFGSDFGSIGLAGAAQQQSNANDQMIGKIGEVIGKVGSAIGSSPQDKGSEGKVYEPGHNAGSAPIETRFSGHVRRRGEG